MAAGNFRTLVTDSGRILYVAERALSHPQVVTSATHPTSPQVGDWIFESDTGALLQYQSATTGWTPPWNTAWGQVASAQATTAQNSVTTLVDVTSVTVTLTAVAHRNYKITVNVPRLANGGAATGVTLHTTDGSNNIIQSSQLSIIASGFGCISQVAPLQSPAAGSITWKARIISSAACNVANTATSPSVILVEDVGPNGAPA